MDILKKNRIFWDKLVNIWMQMSNYLYMIVFIKGMFCSPLKKKNACQNVFNFVWWSYIVRKQKKKEKKN